MPLPCNGPLSLQGHSKPGDAVHSKPKQAMIIRMSNETLDALGDFPNHPQMEFEFGANPGIYIGKSFYPMRPLKENSPHELYLRAFTAAKPLVPLKLYANVTGKFTVDRELDSKVEEKFRDRTLEAEKQRTDRKAILLDAPLALPVTKGGKRKAQPSAVAKKSIQHARSAATSATPTPSASQATTRPSTNDPALTMRAIRCLAAQPRTSEEFIRLVGGQNCGPAHREELLDILREVAEQTDPVRKGSGSAGRLWNLTRNTWLQIRPYESPSLDESQKTTLARQARIAFGSMKIPATDPVWEHVRYRPPNETHATNTSAAPSAVAGPSKVPQNVNSKPATSSSKAEAPQKRTAAADAKDRKGKGKSETVAVKNEGKKVTQADAASKDRDAGEPVDDVNVSAQRPAVRRPGSGYKAKPDAHSLPRNVASSGESSSRPSRDTPPSNLPTRPSPALQPSYDKKHTNTDSKMRSTKEGRERELDTRIPKRRLEDDLNPDREKNGLKRQKAAVAGVSPDSDRDIPRGRDPHGRIPKKSATGADTDREKRIVRESKADRELGREREREREKDIKRELLDNRRTKDTKPSQEAGGSNLSHLKQRKVKRENDDDSGGDSDGVQKRRKSNDLAPSRAPNPALLLPKKPEMSYGQSTLPRQKFKKEASPSHRPVPAPSTSTTGSTASSSAQNLHRNQKPLAKPSGASKLRRKSPIYTSSESEGEIRSPKPAALATSSSSQAMDAKPTINPPSAASSNNPSHSPDEPPSRLPLNLPEESDTLRTRYRKRYRVYQRIHQRLMQQKTKAEDLLSIGSATEDSDGDVELLSVEELRKLEARRVALQNELLALKAAWEAADA